MGECSDYEDRVEFRGYPPEFYSILTFKHDSSICDIEWKYTPYNVTMGECSDYEDRVEFRGNYDKSECGLKFSEAKAEDTGDWTCEFEEYNKGGNRGDGAKSVGNFKVIVDVPTTTTTTTPTTTTT